MKVLIDGQPDNLTAQDVIGTGGEGTVYRKKGAVKVYHQPTTLRANKLRAIVGKQIAQTTLPEQLVTDMKGAVIGFKMPELGIGYLDVAQLSNVKYRRSAKVTTLEVARLFINGSTVVDAIHKAGFCIGDFSDVNEKFSGQSMWFVDADAWQFGPYACPVATEQFVSPRLYGLDLSQKPVFTPDDDWYSYAVLLFKSLTGVHPYGGTHRQIKTLLDRAVSCVPVWHKDVKYPSMGLPLAMLGYLMNGFVQVFEQHKSGKLLVGQLLQWADELIPCPNCGQTYPRLLSNCPVCQERNTIPVNVKETIRRDLVLSVKGDILQVHVYNGQVYSLVREGKWLYFYKNDQRLEREADAPNTVYDFLADGQHINLKGDMLQTASRSLPTTRFALTGRAQLRTNGRYIFRIAGGNLMYGEQRGSLWVERPVRPVRSEHTWYAVAPDEAEVPTVCGYFQVERLQQWWLSRAGRLYDNLALTELEPDETLRDVLVRFGTSGVVILRLTEQAGVTYKHVALWHEADGLMNRPRVKADSLPHGCVYGFNRILYGSDQGLVQENLLTGAVKTFEDAPVEEGDSLHLLGNQLVVVKASSIIRIAL